MKNAVTTDHRQSEPDTRQTGPAYWRSLEELAETEQFRAFVENEFPGYEPEQFTGPNRRQFLAVMGASMMLAGLSGCRRWPRRKLAPYTARPEGFVPGKFERYATAYEMAGVAKPLLVTAVDGRPIKIEGNPDHPASRGAADLYAQASILDLYNPHRLQYVKHRTGDKVAESTWSAFGKWSAERMAELEKKQGVGFVVLSEATSSPTVLRLREQLQNKLPKMQWLTWEAVHKGPNPIGLDFEESMTKLLRPIYHFDKAEVIVSIDNDFLMMHPNAVQYAREFAAGRNPDNGRMSKLIVVESTYTVTGSMADVRYAASPYRINAISEQLHKRFNGGGPCEDEVAESIYQSIKDHRGTSLIVPGFYGSHALQAWKLNQLLGNNGKTVTYTRNPDSSIASTIPDGIDTLLLIGGNAAHDDWIRTSERISGARHTIHLTHAENETSQLCDWVLPRAHYLEAWGDCRSYDGTISITQPLIHPIFEDAPREQGGRSVIELLAGLLGEKVTRDTGHKHVRQTLKPQLPDEKTWRKSLHDGLIADSQFKTVVVAKEGQRPETPNVDADFKWVLQIRPDYSLYDGRFADNGWLQELPDPITKIVWDNAALVSPADAKKLDVEHGDLINIEVAKVPENIKLALPVYVLPGQADGVITTTLGYGRTVAGPVGTGVGFSMARLREGVHEITSISKKGPKYKLATTQDHHAIDIVGMRRRGAKVGELIREQTLHDYQHPHEDHHGHGTTVPLTMFGEPDLGDPEPDYRWAMSIDLNKCTGCNACVIACQAENNIPIVGKDEVAMGREMHWLRIDRYFAGDAESADVRAVHQPMMCQHCEDAPCEQVCPVAATVHDAEGLNVMVYNRCIGTRYCSNNCPYKVRRFNYFDYHVKPHNEGHASAIHLGPPDAQQHKIDPVRQMQFNPQVTVRMRGVMEKCTYCTQRIQDAKITAKVEHEQGKRESAIVRDGEITPACAATCATGAIVFGNLKDKNSRVSKLHHQQRSYDILGELNVQPRTKYMKRIRNVEKMEDRTLPNEDHA